MQLPDTDNATYIFAFKKGYRSAMDGRSLSYIPSQIKLDSTLRDYFHQGWNQYHEDLAEAEESDQESPWKNKAIWMTMAILAGLATASVMIDNIRKEQQPSTTKNQTKQPITPETGELTLKDTSNPEDFRLVTNSPKPKSEQSQIQPTPPITQPTHKNLKENPHSNNSISLGLLSTSERSDLKSTLSQYPRPITPNSNKLLPSTITVARATLSNNLTQNQPAQGFAHKVPKYIREVYFITQIKNAKGHTLYHQWLYDGRVMAIIPFQVKTKQDSIWSKKQLSSAWSGQWFIEVLNSDKQPIYRYEFNYGR